MKRSLVYSIGCAAVVAVAGCTSHQAKPGVGINLADRDTTVNPTQDFFHYANGSWINANPVPDDQVRWGSFAILGEDNKNHLREIAEEASKKSDSKKGSPEQMVGDFYFSAMDTANIEKQGAAPIKGNMDAIDGIKDMKGARKCNLLKPRDIFF